MSFPPNPQLGAIHTVDRRLWTFNGEGWEQGRQILSPPAEDPGSPLVPPVVGPIYIPLLQSYADLNTYFWNLGDTNDPTSPTYFYRDSPSPAYATLLWDSPRYSSALNPSGSKIATRGSLVLPDTVPGAPPYDLAFNFAQMEILNGASLFNLGHCFILGFKPSSAWSSGAGALLSLNQYYAASTIYFPFTIWVDPVFERVGMGVSYGDDFSYDYTFNTPNGSVVMGDWNYMVLQFLFSQAASPPPFFSAFDFTLHLNGTKYSGSNSKAISPSVANIGYIALGTQLQYNGGGQNDSADGFRFRGELCELAYRPDGFGVYNWIDDTRAAALWAAFQTGV